MMMKRFSKQVSINLKGEGMKKLLMLGIICILFPLSAIARNSQYDEQPYCREVTDKIKINGRYERVNGMACQQPNGEWKFVSMDDYRNGQRGYTSSNITQSYAAPTRVYVERETVYLPNSGYSVFLGQNSFNRQYYSGYGHQGYGFNYGHKPYKQYRRYQTKPAYHHNYKHKNYGSYGNRNTPNKTKHIINPLTAKAGKSFSQSSGESRTPKE